MKKENDCSKCHYYHCEQDYWGEFDEYCDIYSHKNYCFPSCKHSLFVRKLIYIKVSIQHWIWDKQAERNYLREEKERYKLNMDEEEYFDYKYKKGE